MFKHDLYMNIQREFISKLVTKEDVQDFLSTANTSGLKVKHIINDFTVNMGGATIAYFRPKGSSIIELSIAVCNAKDQFNKKKGRLLAVTKFFLHNTITMPIDKKENTVSFINERFGSIV